MDLIELSFKPRRRWNQVQVSTPGTRREMPEFGRGQTGAPSLRDSNFWWDLAPSTGVLG